MVVTNLSAHLERKLDPAQSTDERQARNGRFPAVQPEDGASLSTISPLECLVEG
jgi:hypothetical protein